MWFSRGLALVSTYAMFHKYSIPCNTCGTSLYYVSMKTEGIQFVANKTSVLEKQMKEKRTEIKTRKMGTSAFI